MNYFNKWIIKDIKEIIIDINKYEKLRNSRILITGASGMLATYMIYTLLYLNDTNEYGIKVIGLVRNKEKALNRFKEILNRKDFEILVQDVCKELNIEEEIDYIIHAASQASPKFITTDPVGIVKANTLGTINVLELARKKKIKNLLFTSTREIYGEVDKDVLSIQENNYGIINPLESRACYPESKRVAETLCKSYFDQYRIPFNIVRIAHSYGPGMEINNDGRVMADFISDTVNYKNIVLKSTGEVERAFCYISDAVRAMFLVMLDGIRGEAYNIANETEEIAIKDVANLLVTMFPERCMKVEFNILDSNSNTGYTKVPRVRLNTTKVENLGWKPQVCLKDGLYRTVKSFDE